MTIRIKSGGLITLDPDADEAFEVDWDREHLPDGVGISTSTWIIDGDSAALDDHDAGIGDYDADDLWVAAALGRVTRVFLTGLTAIATGQRYTVTNRIVTNTAPPETKDASFEVLIAED